VIEKGLESAAGKAGWDLKLQCKWLGLSVMLLGTMSISPVAVSSKCVGA